MLQGGARAPCVATTWGHSRRRRRETRLWRRGSSWDRTACSTSCWHNTKREAAQRQQHGRGRETEPSCLPGQVPASACGDGGEER